MARKEVNPPAAPPKAQLQKKEAVKETKESVAKSSSSLISKDQTMLEEGSHRYEKVYPPSDKRSLVAMADSWSDLTRSWWDRKSKRQRRFTMVHVCAIFTVVVIGLLALIIAGGFVMYKRQREKIDAEKHAVDKLLTTKTSLCRAQYSDQPPECIYEDIYHYPECTPGPYCKRIRWTVTSGSSVVEFVRSEKSLWMNTTEFSDCGIRQWCRSGQCVPKHPGWWQRVDRPFPDANAPEPWVERRIPNETGDISVTDISPCLEAGSDGVLEDLRRIYNDYGRPGVCNKDLCSTGKVQYGVSVKFYHCNLSLPNPTTGMRQRLCDGPPMKLFACHRCNRSAIQQPDQFCAPGNEGANCTEFGRAAGVCFYGICYKIQNVTSVT